MYTTDPFAFAMAVRILRKNAPGQRSNQRNHPRAMSPARPARGGRSIGAADGSTRV
jgi:hypothetical protein